MGVCRKWLHHPTKAYVLAYGQQISTAVENTTHHRASVACNGIRRGALQPAARCVVKLNIYSQRVGISIYKLGKTGQRHHWRTGMAQHIHGGSIVTAIALLLPEHVERSHKGCSLSAVVVQSKELESGIARRAQVALNLILIGQILKSAAGIEEPVSHILHTVVAEQVLEDVEVASLIGSCIEWTLAEVGEGAPLSLLVCHNGAVAHHLHGTIRQGVGSQGIVGRALQSEVAWAQQLVVVVVC